MAEDSIMERDLSLFGSLNAHILPLKVMLATREPADKTCYCRAIKKTLAESAQRANHTTASHVRLNKFRIPSNASFPHTSAQIYPPPLIPHKH
jgi:hypothetical protein